ncbi:MAG: hypothetical protein QNJ12_17460 [Ilumatobacter sp.]|uniref:hypothetical protein n=1 Tax=Ilumatobacter sp. TaxID=1967498 RepID=UPI0026392910|nr:hypothetical protein [Ilumatobacter sp.]MDJ0770585.1 hypothetical protein [Ilumatobacter sp.]
MNARKRNGYRRDRVHGAPGGRPSRLPRPVEAPRRAGPARWALRFLVAGTAVAAVPVWIAFTDSEETTPARTVVETGSLEAEDAEPLSEPARVLDTRIGASTVDGRLAGIGLRPPGSILPVPVVDRIGVAEPVRAVLVEITTANARSAGQLSVSAPGARQLPDAEPLDYVPGPDSTASVIVPIGPGGQICVATTGPTDVAVDVEGWFPAPRAAAPSDVPADTPCQGRLFDDRMIVAMYGTDRTPRLGVLGEQDPAAAARRLDEIAEPWRAGDRSVLPAFELIATLATSDPGDDGLYRLRSSHEFVRRYLDEARRQGYYLILDLQPGRSDFLTEAKYYEDLLREPDVGLALDPEWRTEPPARPRGGFIGTVDAAEVNAVINWLADLVAEEQLPEKLLVVHQFTPDMLTNRDQVVTREGIAFNVHMDGFGRRAVKLDTYSKIRVEAPWYNGLKLFYDEDVDIFTAADVLDGVFDPTPVLVTYQ